MSFIEQCAESEKAEWLYGCRMVVKVLVVYPPDCGG